MTEQLLEDVDTIEVTLEIDNVYEDGDDVRTVVQTEIEPPPIAPYPHPDAYDEWEQGQIFPHTGTGKEEGNSAYFVKVTASSHPKLLEVGTEFEFGL